MPKNETIAETECHGCGRTVELRADIKRKVYYFCPGRSGAEGCGHHEKWGSDDSRKIIAEAAKSDRENVTDKGRQDGADKRQEGENGITQDIHENRPETGNEPEPRAEPEQPARKRRGVLPWMG